MLFAYLSRGSRSQAKGSLRLAKEHSRQDRRGFEGRVIFLQTLTVEKRFRSLEDAERVSCFSW